MLDLGQLLPGAKRDAKLDTKSDRAVINEAAELKVPPLPSCPAALAASGLAAPVGDHAAQFPRTHPEAPG